MKATPTPQPAPAVAPTPAPVPAPAQVAAAEPPRCTLENEAAALQSAQRELEESTHESLIALEALERDCPGGELVEERRAARALALCALGRKDDGRAELDWLQRNKPASPALPRVRRACEGP
jgi:hypothetical protein